MRVYYAHSMHLYNKPQEQRDVDYLHQLGFEVENPNQPHHQKGADEQGMIYFLNVVKSCDAVAFRALPGGDIGAGVGQEIRWAEERDIPIFELPTWVGRKFLTVDETRAILKEFGAR